MIYAVWEPTDGERKRMARGENIRVGIRFIEPTPPTVIEVVDEKEVR